MLFYFFNELCKWIMYETPEFMGVGLTKSYTTYDTLKLPLSPVIVTGIHRRPRFKLQHAYLISCCEQIKSDRVKNNIKHEISDPIILNNCLKKQRHIENLRGDHDDNVIFKCYFNMSNEYVKVFGKHVDGIYTFTHIMKCKFDKN